MVRTSTALCFAVFALSFAGQVFSETKVGRPCGAKTASAQVAQCCEFLCLDSGMYCTITPDSNASVTCVDEVASHQAWPRTAIVGTLPQPNAAQLFS